METISLNAIAKALGTPAPFDAEITCISTDTRQLQEGCLFLALRGAKFDGKQIDLIIEDASNELKVIFKGGDEQ